MIGHVTIVGGGFAGTLLAINLLRYGGPRATLVERRPVAGKGLAYGAAHPDHLLNVRAANMSAFPDDPDHFIRWLATRGSAEHGTAFVPRLLYGEYLGALLAQARSADGDRLEVIEGDAVDMACRADGMATRLADGRVIESGAAVLALGNLPPQTPPGIDPDALSAARYAGNPWDPTTARGLGGDDAVLVVGTGLTMVDVVLMLAARGFGGRIVALSRRGLLPHSHADASSPWQRMAERPRLSPAALLAATRTRSAEIGWRNAVDELRPFTQGLWAQASHADRARFLRHLRPWWDIHRHRLAPVVAERMAELHRSGRLDVVAGKIVAAIEQEDGVAVTWRARGETGVRHALFQRIVNCTGPQGDLQRTDEPLLAALTARGVIRADAERLGIDVDGAARAVSATGAANPHLFALGPMTRGAFWEVVAVPDIRRQSWDLARRLANAHWVGGEGL